MTTGDQSSYGPYIQTPLTKSYPISGKLPFQVYLKNEFTQPSGSFKSRGLGHLIKVKAQEAAADGKKIALFSSSGGNAGLATSTAAAYYGLPCTVVLPEVSKLKMKLKIEATGANVVVAGRHWGEADKYLREEIIAKQDTSEVLPVYCHPFDNELVWEGHSTMVDEIKSQLGESIVNLKGIICSVGGGGLYAGIVRGLIRNELNVPVVAVETENAPSLHAAIKAGHVVVLDSVKTVATSLASPYAAEQALKYAQSYPTHSLLIKDEETLSSVVQFVEDHNIVVEPACGAALRPVYKPELLYQCFGHLDEDDIIIVVVCGGSSYGAKEIAELIQ